jgi:hypothetical protein
MENKKEKPAQLVWDRGLPIWRATRAAIKAGFPTKRVNLDYFANDEAALFARCIDVRSRFEFTHVPVGRPLPRFRDMR